MNDVLPKPFTKEGLLNMLEKHLGHLKKLPDGLDVVPNTASTIHGPVSHSLKDDASPAQSPSTVSNWNSPNQFSGISPSGSGQFIPPVSTGYAIDQNSIAYQQQPTTPISAAPRGVGHRRQVSEMSGADDLSTDPKRARMYATTNAAMNQMRRV